MTKTRDANREDKRMQRQAAREGKQQSLRRREAQRRKRSLFIWIGSVALVVVVAALLGRAALRPKPGERIASQGRDHIAVGQSHPAYNSNPPTSGWHYAQTATWGAVRSEIQDEYLVHNLEHGGIWISYRDPSDTALVEKLEALASRHRSKVIVTPRAKNDSPIAVAAWERLLKLDAYDEKRIVEFINAFRNKGPERVPD